MVGLYSYQTERLGVAENTKFDWYWNVQDRDVGEEYWCIERWVGESRRQQSLFRGFPWENLWQKIYSKNNHDDQSIVIIKRLLPPTANMKTFNRPWAIAPLASKTIYKNQILVKMKFIWLEPIHLPNTAASTSIHYSSSHMSFIYHLKLSIKYSKYIE